MPVKLPDLFSVATAGIVEPAAMPVGITLTSTASPTGEPEPVGEPVSSPAARGPQPRRIDQFACLAQADQDQGAVPRNRKASW